MKLEFLGDAFDCWKGFLFLHLQNEGILKDFSVDPMITDISNWHGSGWKLYANLLQIRRNQIIKHKTKLEENREKYFSEITHEGDLFLDPNTGIAPKNYSPIKNYIKVEEVHRLLDNKSLRLLCIYQHAPRAQQFSDRINELVSVLNNAEKIFCLAYITPAAALLFLSKKENRVMQVNTHFKIYPKERVKMW